MKWNTKINIAQLSITTIGLVQLLNNAILMAILFVFAKASINHHLEPNFFQLLSIKQTHFLNPVKIASNHNPHCVIPVNQFP